MFGMKPRLAKDGFSVFDHELNRDGTGCSEDCPACLALGVKQPPKYDEDQNKRSQLNQQK